MKRFRIIWRRKRVKPSQKEYVEYKHQAEVLVKDRLAYYNGIYGFRINRVTIKNQKSRWGSCSKKGNLNFNYRIVKLTPDLADYVVVHELCHLKEFNHSKRFWQLVAHTLPHYKEIKKKFKKIIIK